MPTETTGRSIFRVTAAHPYDNWRYEFDDLSEALALVGNDGSHSIHNVIEFVDGRIKAKHGTWRRGKRYVNLECAVNG